MKNYIQEGKVIDFTATETLTSGQGYIHGNLFGVICNDVVSGQVAELAVSGVFELGKASVGWTAGSKLYWDNTNKKITNVPSTNNFVGIAINTVSSEDTHGKVLLIPSGSAELDTIGEIVTSLEALTGENKLSTDALRDGIVNKVFTATEKIKLANINVSKLFAVDYVVTAIDQINGSVLIDTGFGEVITMAFYQICRDGVILDINGSIKLYLTGDDAGKVKIVNGGSYTVTAGDIISIIAKV